MEKLIVCLIAAFWWGLFYLFFTKDRSRYRNCYLLIVALLHSILVLLMLSGSYMFDVFMALIITFLVAILIVPFFLIQNGIVMIRREGKSLANLLSLLFGILIGIGELTTIFTVFSIVMVMNDYDAYIAILNVAGLPFILISISIIYLSLSFLVFMIYVLFLQIVPKKRDFDYVIIHGAGLLEGNKVSKLLSDRIDKAIEVYHKDPTPPIMIPSGGQGANETVSEARAMADYLLSKGIPEEKIIPEDKSTTTYENLLNSKSIIDGRADGHYIALVTSNYHVYRALRHCRKIGLECTGIGSRVAFYYWPSALIREYIAVHAEPKHLVMFIAGWLACILPILYVFLKRG